MKRSLKYLEESNCLRRLGPTEEFFWRVDLSSPMNFGTVVKLKGAIDVDEIRSALDSIQKRHPLLQTYIKSINGQPYFFRCSSSIPLNYYQEDDNCIYCGDG